MTVTDSPSPAAPSSEASRAALPALGFDRFPSPIGDLHLVFDAAGTLYSLEFDDDAARFARLLRRFHGIAPADLTVAPAPSELRERLAAFFAGEITAVDSIAVATGGTAFQRDVWSALRTIPAGTTWSYAALARAIGRPSACRAVGAANGSNPVAIVVPCHRVIGANRDLTGYGGGLERKRWLLAHERRYARSGQGELAFADER